MDPVLIVNPRSAGGRTEREWPRMREIIREALGPFEARFTSGPGDATAKARDAIAQGATLVVALGGDGSINEVMNGFFADGADSTAVTFGVIPSGTGGDFIRTLGIPRDLGEAAAHLKNAPVRALDVGKMTLTGRDGRPIARHFINIASFGIAGVVDDYVNRSSKSLGGKLSFALATVRAAAVYKNARVRVTLDDQAAREGEIYNVAVCNGRYFGGGMKVAPDAVPDDGQFDVVTMGDFGFSDLLLRGLDIYSGKHLQNPKVSVARARRVKAESLDGDVLLDVDGEQPGKLPATFELLPGAIRVKG